MEASPSYNLLGLFTTSLSPGSEGSACHADVTGVWRCDDGGSYFVRQIGPDVLWYGEGPRDRPFFANVAHGRAEGDGRLRLMWADVPKGAAVACGALLLQIAGEDEMWAINATGGFGGRRWTRQPGISCPHGIGSPVRMR